MNFGINFSAGTRSAVQLPSRAVGIKAIDQIRTELEIPNLDASLIQEIMTSEYENPFIEVSESVARDSGLFDEDSKIVVACTEGFLNQFVLNRVIVARSEADGAILSTKLQQTLDHKKVIDAWIEAWYPTEWGTDTHQGEE